MEEKANLLLALKARDFRLYWLALSLVGPRVALAGGALIVLAYVWLSLVRATALKNLVLAPKPG